MTSDTNSKTFAARLGALMSREGITQQELADRLIVDRSYLNRLLRGKKQPSARLVQQVTLLETISARGTQEPGAPQFVVEESGGQPYASTALNEVSDREIARLADQLRDRINTLQGETARQAALLLVDILSRYRDAGRDRDRVGWLNLELRRILDSAPFPKQTP